LNYWPARLHDVTSQEILQLFISRSVFPSFPFILSWFIYAFPNVVCISYGNVVSHVYAQDNAPGLKTKEYGNQHPSQFRGGYWVRWCQGYCLILTEYFSKHLDWTCDWIIVLICRKVVWKHILNVYPEGRSGKERMDYMKKKAYEYQALRDCWKEMVQNGQVSF
jgi:hypothetical protein